MKVIIVCLAFVAFLGATSVAEDCTEEALCDEASKQPFGDNDKCYLVQEGSNPEGATDLLTGPETDITSDVTSRYAVFESECQIKIEKCNHENQAFYPSLPQLCEEEQDEGVGDVEISSNNVELEKLVAQEDQPDDGPKLDVDKLIAEA